MNAYDLQFPVIGHDDTCDCCHYNTVYDVCEMCRTGLVTDNRVAMHGLDPETGKVHLDVCSDCAKKLLR